MVRQLWGADVPDPEAPSMAAQWRQMVTSARPARPRKRPTFRVAQTNDLFKQNLREELRIVDDATTPVKGEWSVIDDWLLGGWSMDEWSVGDWSFSITLVAQHTPAIILIPKLRHSVTTPTPTHPHHHRPSRPPRRPRASPRVPADHRRPGPFETRPPPVRPAPHAATPRQPPPPPVRPAPRRRARGPQTVAAQPLGRRAGRAQGSRHRHTP